MGRPKRANHEQQNEIRCIYCWLNTTLDKEQKDMYLALGIKQPSLSQWKSAEIDLAPERLARLLMVLKEWAKELPKDGWVHEPYVYTDTEGAGVRTYVFDFFDESLVGRIYRKNLWVMCDRLCRKCHRLTPGRGRYCMHCQAPVSPHVLDGEEEFELK